ncbi:hypothetical protein ACTFIV_010324 [Dictyostelium citrinum]
MFKIFYKIYTITK